MPNLVNSNFADVAQLVEHVLGKNEVSGSIPDIGSKQKRREKSSAVKRKGLKSLKGDLCMAG